MRRRPRTTGAQAPVRRAFDLNGSSLGARTRYRPVQRTNYPHRSAKSVTLDRAAAGRENRIIDLATCTFVQKRENVLLIGKTGLGKSHIAQALGHRACIAGYTVVFTSAHDMLTQLRAARADDSYDRRMLRYTTPDLLIIDDLGLRPLRHDEPLDLYEIFRQRYERGAMIITSNRAIEEWPPLFHDALMASAAMDRLLHHSQVLLLEGKTFRNPPPDSRPATPAPPADS